MLRMLFPILGFAIVFMAIQIVLCAYFANRASETEDTVFMPIWLLWLMWSILGVIIILSYWNKVTKSQIALQDQVRENFTQENKSDKVR